MSLQFVSRLEINNQVWRAIGRSFHYSTCIERYDRDQQFLIEPIHKKAIDP
ncbi:hypothetical protein [Nostoc sp. ChiQUE01b]|uniref:hypothetical protein n=1 Tax=Nostoc sp. ChiQUE01b TaxID=3075376 RepID=UPI002AD49FAA|nr:hypothetical protein [Nostoc sp. ChiQUE01b]